MALLVGGQVEAAERAYAWARTTQRARRLVADEDRRRRGRGPPRRDQHVGLPRGRRLAPLAGPARRGVRPARCGRPSVAPSTAWSPCSCRSAASPGRRSSSTGGRRPVNEDALLAGSSSIYQSLRAGVALADLIDEPQPEWELAGGRLGHALREHRDLFLDKSEFSMDWYYPVLGGAVRGDAARALIDARWDTFVEPGLGIRCVSTNPWVTGAETCELVLALDAVGDRDRALQLLADMQHLRTEDGCYWTGYVFPDGRQLAGRAHDVHRGRGDPGRRRALATAARGSDIMRGTTLAPDFAELGLECGCAVSRPGRRRRPTSDVAPASSPAPRPRRSRRSPAPADRRRGTAAGRRRRGRGTRRG